MSSMLYMTVLLFTHNYIAFTEEQQQQDLIIISSTEQKYTGRNQAA